MRLLIYTDLEWALGSIHMGLAKALVAIGHEVTLKSWAEPFSSLPHYDLVMTLPSCVGPLLAYGVPKKRIVIVAHGECDIQKMIAAEGIDAFDQYAAYGVVSDSLACSSLAMGVRRIPLVARLGVDFQRFYTLPSSALSAVGYVSVMQRHNEFGVEQKRGALAQASIEAAGLRFALAEGYSIETMPKFYKGVDAIIMPSLQEGAGLPPLEAAAAGRLVIGTPVGHFPRLAYEGLGLMGPLDEKAFATFVVKWLRFFRDNPMEFTKKCGEGQAAARARDWSYVVKDWGELFKRAHRASCLHPVSIDTFPAHCGICGEELSL